MIERAAILANPIYPRATRSLLMTEPPALHYKLRSREPGSFGTSVMANCFEFITTSWFRFGCFLVWIPIVPLCMGANFGNYWLNLAFTATSPILAIACYLLLKLFSILIYFLPGRGFGLGWFRIAYIWTFSRLIVEAAPRIEMPAWLPTGRRS